MNRITRKTVRLSPLQSATLVNSLPSEYRPALPILTRLIVPSGLPAENKYDLYGMQVRRFLSPHSDWGSKAGIQVPFDRHNKLRVIDPRLLSSGEPVEQVLRRAGQGGHFPVLGRTRSHRPEGSRLIVTLDFPRLKRLKDCTDGDARAFGVRELESGYSFLISPARLFASPVAALQQKWSLIYPEREESLEQWVWTADVCSVTLKKSEGHTLREIERLLAEADHEDQAIKAAYREIERRRTLRDSARQHAGNLLTLQGKSSLQDGGRFV